jgi:uncharacterized protein
MRNIGIDSFTMTPTPPLPTVQDRSAQGEQPRYRLNLFNIRARPTLGFVIPDSIRDPASSSIAREKARPRIRSGVTTLMTLIATLLLAALTLTSPAAAQTFPKFTGFVVDAANVLPEATKADLTRKLDALQKDTHRQLIVATIPDLQGYPIEDYGYKLGRAWGVGLKDVNNGAILFIAPNEPKGHRGPRIEVGYGLEPILTDALSFQIINDKMMPLLQSGEVPQAMEAGTDAIIAQLRANPDEAKARTDAAIAEFDKAHKSRSSSNDGFPIGLVVWLVIILVFISLRYANRKQGRAYRKSGGGSWPIILWGPGWGGGGRDDDDHWGGWGGGGGFGGGSGGGWGGGGFSGGGGGSFGGGGASGGW